MMPLVALGEANSSFAIRVKREEHYAPRVDAKWVTGARTAEELSILVATAFSHSTFNTSLQFFLSGKTVSALVPEGSNYRDFAFAKYTFEDNGGGVLNGQWAVRRLDEERVVFSHTPKIKTT